MEKHPIRIPPFWKIVARADSPDSDRQRQLVLAPGQGWGTGAHDTTQLCLQALAHFYLRSDRRGFHMLDFGSGSGLLSIGAAKLGATVDAVEIDLAAIEHAKANARTNNVETRIRFETRIESCDALAKCDLVIANVFNIVLIEHAPTIIQSMKPMGALVLSGIVATDVPSISNHYSTLLHSRKPQMFSSGEWRALVWWQGT